jgi:hypothetical protein
MLCQSQVVPRLVTAAADILGGIGREYSQTGSCRSSGAIPFLKIQGVKDPFITYDRDIDVDGESAAVGLLQQQQQALLGGLGQGIFPDGRSSGAIPFLKIQGVQDPFVTYDRDTDVTVSQQLSCQCRLYIHA